MLLGPPTSVEVVEAYDSWVETRTRDELANIANDPNRMEAEEGPVSLLQAQVPHIVKALHRQMKEKSIKTRQGCFALLTELILVLPGALAAHMNLLVPGVQFSLASSQSNSNMKIDTLSFVQVSSKE